jgi:hypothetical protein
MITEVAVWVTNDGRQFVTEEKARAHVVDCLFEVVGGLVDGAGRPQSPADRLAVVKALVGTVEQGQWLLNRLNAILS